MNKMSTAAHSFPEFKALRKQFEGINATAKGSEAKSIRRHGSKLKALAKLRK